MTTTTSAPSIKSLEQSSSILAPLLIGVRDLPGSALATQILLTAMECVPKTTVIRNVPAGRKTTQVPFVRTLYGGKPPVDAYSNVVRCSDQPQQEGAGAESVNWEISFLHLPAEPYQAESPDVRWVVRLDVTHFRIRRQAVLAAQQLALFRHLFAASYLAIDPSALIRGGQHDWRPQWWPDNP